MKFRNAFLVLAAAGLMTAPVAAQAGTRAGSSPVYAVDPGQGGGPDGVQVASLKGKAASGFAGLAKGVWLPLLMGTAIIGFVMIDDDGNATFSSNGV